VTSEEIVTTDTSYEVYVEGGVEFTLSVRAVNNMGLHSDYLDITETSPEIGKYCQKFTHLNCTQKVCMHVCIANLHPINNFYTCIY